MPALQTAKELCAKRATLHGQLTALLAAPKGDNGTLSAEQRMEFERIEKDIDAFKDDIDRIERHEAREAELAKSTGTVAAKRDTAVASEDETAERKAAYSRTFMKYTQFGMRGLTGDEQAIMEGRHAVVDGKELRAMGVNVDTAGGYAVPEELRTPIVQATLAYGGMRQAKTTKITTAGGNDLWIPTTNDTTNTGEQVGENNPVGTQDAAIAAVKLSSYMFSSKMVKVSRQLLQDSAIDVPSLLGKLLGERLGRIQNTRLTVGTGASTINGLVTAATSGVSGASGQTTSFIYNDFVDLMHSVDPTYRDLPGAQWMMHDSGLKVIRKLKDGEGRPLWQPGLASGAPDLILGKPYTINQDVAAPAASAKSLLFGDFSTYWIRDVQDIILLRLDERYAENLQVAFIAFARCDGNLIDAGTHPIKYFAHAAS